MKSQISCFGQLTFVITLSLCAQVFAQQVSLNFIPDAFSANDMSPDGRYVVGSQLQGGNYLWDSVENEFTTLPEALSAVAVSDDGQTVLGSINNPETPDTSLGSVAAIWTPTTQAWESLGYLPDSLNCPSKSSPYELSADGSAAVGLSWDGCNAFATHWTADTGMVGLENLANGSNRASVVSADGRIVAGFAQGSFSRTPAVWDSTTGQGQLLDPPNGDALGEIHGMNDEGTILLGEYLIDDGTQTSGKATQWTNVNGSWERETIGNGSFRPGWTGTPTDISDDGTIVGFDIFFGTRRAWIKRPGEEIVELNQWLTSNGVTVPVNPNSGAPEILEVAQAISTDGRVIIGHGGIFSLGAWRIEIYSDCDFDQDFTCNVTDIDALTNAIVTNSDDLLFDLDGNGEVTLDDRDEWLALAGGENLASGNPYLLGDANLDGSVDASDFNVWNSNKFATTAAWSRGDFNADGTTDTSDFNIWNNNKFTSSDVTAVPEPQTFVLAFFAVVGYVGFSRKRCCVL